MRCDSEVKRARRFSISTGQLCRPPGAASAEPLAATAASRSRTCESCCTIRSWNCRHSTQTSRSRALGRLPADAAALTRDSASPSSATGRCDSLSASSISVAAVAAAHARSYAELTELAECEPRAGSATCASAVLRLEGAYLLVELVGDVCELIDRRVVQGRLVAGAQLVLARLEVEALEVGLHVVVVLLDRLHGRDHLLLRGRAAVRNLARCRRQPALVRVGLQAHGAGGRQNGQSKDSLRGLHG